MKTIAEIEKDILDITLQIQNYYPELSKYIEEIPVNYDRADRNQISIKNMQDYYNSLVEIVSKYAKNEEIKTENNAPDKSKFDGFPIYPPSDDIYARGKEETLLNPEDISNNKTPNEDEGMANEKAFDTDMSGDDLDVPGAELDDQQESVGSEDEENNYYSLGGDNHDN
ncbi:MAG: hypothetical protein ACK4RM_07860 [Flavobacterium sp.]